MRTWFRRTPFWPSRTSCRRWSENTFKSRGAGTVASRRLSPPSEKPTQPTTSPPGPTSSKNDYNEIFNHASHLSGSIRSLPARARRSASGLSYRRPNFTTFFRDLQTFPPGCSRWRKYIREAKLLKRGPQPACRRIRLERSSLSYEYCSRIMLEQQLILRSRSSELLSKIIVHMPEVSYFREGAESS